MNQFAWMARHPVLFALGAGLVLVGALGLGRKWGGPLLFAGVAVIVYAEAV